MTKDKKKRAESTNFHLNLSTLLSQVGALLAILLEANGIEAGENLTPQIIATLETGAILPILLIVPNLITPIVKVYDKFKSGLFSWDFIKSKNFQTQVITAIGGFIIAFTTVSEEYTVAILAILNAINMAYHVYIKK